MTKGVRSRPLIEPEPDVIVPGMYVEQSASDVPAIQESTWKPGGRFEPGQSGNPNGRPKHKVLSEYLRDIVDPYELAQNLWQFARSGGRLGLEATIYIYNRTDGTPQQQVTLSHADDDPAVIEARRLADSWQHLLGLALVPQAGPAHILIEASTSEPEAEPG